MLLLQYSIRLFYADRPHVVLRYFFQAALLPVSVRLLLSCCGHYRPLVIHSFHIFMKIPLLGILQRASMFTLRSHFCSPRFICHHW